MGYWGWRPLIIVLFISVWITGCSITNRSAATIPPTEYPLVTLTVLLRASPTPTITPSPSQSPTLALTITPFASPTPVIYTVQPGDTLLTIARNFGVDLGVLQAANGDIQPLDLLIGQQLIIPNPRNTADGQPILITATPAPLLLNPPDCYPTPTNRTLCLGQVTNDLNYPVERVTVNIRLLNRDGSVVAEDDTGVEQAIVQPGASAPYAVFFELPWDKEYGPIAWLSSADMALKIDERFISLAVEDEEGHLSSGHYTVSATLYNPETHPAANLRAILTLYNSLGKVAGYRIIQPTATLNPGERLPIQIDVVPQSEWAVIAHTLYVEAQKSG